MFHITFNVYEIYSIVTVSTSDASFVDKSTLLPTTAEFCKCMHAESIVRNITKGDLHVNSSGFAFVIIENNISLTSVIRSAILSSY